MTSVAFLFAGQGAQYDGMLHQLPDHRMIRQTLEEASQLLGCDVLHLDTAATLEKARGAQLCLFVAGVAMARAVLAEGIQPQAVAGLSVGAFAAGVISGAVEFVDALHLVDLRAQRMQEVFSSDYGMGVLVGLDERAVQKLVAEIHTAQVPLYTANVNSPRQIAVAGHAQALESLFLKARQQGARRAEKMNVSTLSHCPLLLPVADELERAAASFTLHPVRIPYISNIGARHCRQPEAVLRDMVHNIAHGVRWGDTMTVLDELQCELFLAMPPGRTLCDLVTENLPAVRSLNMDSCPPGYPARLLR